VLGGHKALGLDKEVMMLECNKHFWGSLAAHYSRRDVLTRLDLGHVNIPTEIGDYISKSMQAALVHGLNAVRALNPVPPPPNKRKAGDNSSVVRASGRKVPTNVVTVAPGGNTRLVVCSIPKEVEREKLVDAGGAHFRSSSVFVLCFLPAAFRESMMFCFVSICMRKQCLAVLYWDAVWVLYAALLCVL